MSKKTFFSSDLAHHHLTELVKVHGTTSILVNLIDDAVEILRGQPRVQFGDDLPQLAGGDEAGAVFVVHPERLLQFGLHSLLVRFFDQEFGAQLAKFAKLDLAGAVFVDLLQDFLELLLRRAETHGAEDVVEVVGAEEILFLDVEKVEAELEDFDLVDLERGGLGDFVEIYVGERVAVVRCHFEWGVFSRRLMAIAGSPSRSVRIFSGLRLLILLLFG